MNMSRCEDVNMRRCEDEKGDTDPTIGRTLRSVSREKVKCLIGRIISPENLSEWFQTSFKPVRGWCSWAVPSSGKEAELKKNRCRNQKLDSVLGERKLISRKESVLK